MITKLFINLSVKDLNVSRYFFQNTGFEVIEEFTNESSVCIKFSDSIFAMLLREESFENFSCNKPAEISKGHEVINALQVDEKSKVDEIADKAFKNGGKYFNDPVDHGFMYVRAFKDPDDHIWEIFWMDQKDDK